MTKEKSQNPKAGNKKSQLEDTNRNRDDEYYTLYEDISAEVSKYKKQLKGKRILCPCDWDESYNEEIVFKEENHIIDTTMFRSNGSIKRVDIEKSKEKFEKNLNLVKCNFVKFLVAQADSYGIKSISACGYDPVTDQGIKFQNVDYCQYDLIITNPPFSQFREFINVLTKNNMEFLVIGPQTAISYKEIFHHIKGNKMWLGYHHHLSGFKRLDGTFIDAKKPEGSIPRACCWYTNLDVSYRHDEMILNKEYNAEKYPFYKEYDGLKPIFVKNTKEIPYNYEKEMAVPITFLQKFNPDQFEIIELWASAEPYLEDGKRTFARIIIRKK